ncbi:MAG: hypothetical protein K8R31_00745, partial [Bacteroidales bacterium]|nr:hypothetical protein [Bacteroidales bacterium]
MDTKIKTSSGAPNMVREQIERFKSISQVKLVLIIITLFLVFGGQKIFAQGVGISEISIVPDASSILELRSTQRGFLTPRMTEAERDVIAVGATANGLIIYNTTTAKLNIYDHATTSWLVLFSGTSGVNSITGTADRITIGGTSADPTIDIANTYVGQNTITTLGTITTGIWNGTTIAIANGGTNSSTALNDDRLMISNTGAIEEAAAMIDGQVVVGSTGAAPQLVNLGGDATIDNAGALTIANNAVTTAKILDDNVTLAKIVDGVADQVLTTDALGNPQYENKSNFTSSALTSTNIFVGSVGDVATDVALSGDATIVNDGTLTIANDAITTVKILDANVTTAKIADLNVTTGKLAADAVDNTKLADDAVQTENILDGEVQTPDIADLNVTTGKLANDAVTTVKITDNNVTLAKIVDGVADQVLTT